MAPDEPAASPVPMSRSPDLLVAPLETPVARLADPVEPGERPVESERGPLCNAPTPDRRLTPPPVPDVCAPPVAVTPPALEDRSVEFTVPAARATSPVVAEALVASPDRTLTDPLAAAPAVAAAGPEATLTAPEAPLRAAPDARLAAPLVRVEAPDVTTAAPDAA